MNIYINLNICTTTVTQTDIFKVFSKSFLKDQNNRTSVIFYPKKIYNRNKFQNYVIFAQTKLKFVALPG